MSFQLFRHPLRLIINKNPWALFRLILILSFVFTVSTQLNVAAKSANAVEPASQPIEGELGQFAPADAFVDDSPYAYYGSENEWSRRMFRKEAADFRYCRRGQRQLLAILDGNPQLAKDYCLSRLEADDNDPEALFMLTVAQCRLNDLEAAFISMNKALEAGLPFGRFLAGPRELLLPLTETDGFRKLAEEYSIQLLHGPMVGDVTERSAKFWVRTVEASPIQVVVSEFDNFADAQKSEITSTDPERDFTAVVEISNLRPDTRYYYEVLIDGRSILGSDAASFRTFPSNGVRGRFQLGFGGCAAYTPIHERVWDTIASQKVTAFLLLGDNVYIDLPEKPGAFHNYTYYRRQSRPEFRRLVQSTPIYTIWDDHDSATDDVWLGPYLDRPAWKIPQWELFRNNWNNPSQGSTEEPGGWFRISIGDVDIFMLDGRYFRTNPFGKNPTMLGPVQKAWLFDELMKSRATFKVIASPVAWSFQSKVDSKDTWNGFHGERAEIFSYLSDHRINGVVLLSSDRHRTEAWRIDRDDGYALYEFASGRLTNIHTHDSVPGSLFSYNEKCSFGLLTFDTAQKDPELNYEIINIDNEITHSLKVKLSQLQQD